MRILFEQRRTSVLNVDIDHRHASILQAGNHVLVVENANRIHVRATSDRALIIVPGKEAPFSEASTHTIHTPTAPNGNSVVARS